MFFMFIFATEKIKEMKKTILFSILLLLTVASAWAVSYPDQGLMPSHYSEGEFFYLPGAGNFRSLEQVGHNPELDDELKCTNPWEGTWAEENNNYSANYAMGKTPSEYAAEYCSLHKGKEFLPEGNPYPGYTSTYSDVMNDVISKCGNTLACQNYAIDAYNLVLGCIGYSMGGNEDAFYLGYFSVPVSTDITFLALMLAAYLGFVAYRKKHFLAKA